jgi:hypothetical protein
MHCHIIYCYLRPDPFLYSWKPAFYSYYVDRTPFSSYSRANLLPFKTPVLHENLDPMTSQNFHCMIKTHQLRKQYLDKYMFTDNTST